MKMKNVLATYAAATVSGMALTMSAHAIDTLVQLNTDGVAGYDVVKINEFDWQSSGDLVIVDELLNGGSTANGLNYTTFTEWAANAVVGDTVAFALNAHARLNDLIDTFGNSVAPITLNAMGTGPGFEITSALTGTDVGQLIAPGLLQFTNISGSYAYYFDTSPDSSVDLGTGFTDGTPFLVGDLGPAGPHGLFSIGSGGDAILRNTVTAYDPNFIETDPAALAPLVGSTFDTLVSLVGRLEDQVCDGCPIGLTPYIVQVGDLKFKADANSEFTAEPRETSVPGTLYILGLGLLGLGLSRRNSLA